ncbi:MAG: hypothetical protein ACK4N5_26495, partial [Myxococcales bacterium]
TGRVKPTVGRSLLKLKALALAGGVALWLGFFPANLGFLGCVALVPFLYLIARVEPRGTYLASFLGGLLFEGRPDGCDEGDAARAFACAQLPTRAPLAAGHAAGGDAPRTLAPGTLPVPPPPFSYQSLLFSTSHDASGGPPQLGLRTVFLSQLGSRANWMTSYHVGLLTTLGRGERAQLVTEFSYMFHWRWAARFLLNAGPFAFGGLRGLGEGVSPFAGVGPNVGASVLPEGWIRLPLEVSLSYRLPLTLLDARHGFSSKGIRIEAHWIELGLGLAFM